MYNILYISPMSDVSRNEVLEAKYLLTLAFLTHDSVCLLLAFQGGYKIQICLNTGHSSL